MAVTAKLGWAGAVCAAPAVRLFRHPPHPIPLPLKEGGVADAGRIEVPGGDLHQNGGLNGQLLDLDQARAAVAADPTPAKA